MTDELIALLDGQHIGRLRQGARGRVTFVYHDNWRDARDAYPLSLSMPLAAQEHGPDTVESFLWGLLPDNEAVLDRWAQKFQVSARNVFALISNVGEDCAGAVQFVPPERAPKIGDGSLDQVEWLDTKDVAGRMRALREDHAAWRLPRDTGQFSLAGAQPKTALFFEKGRWGIPQGRLPTTHILKPPTGRFGGHAENEYMCLALARALGLPVASAEVLRFDKEVAVSIARYDRQAVGGKIIRVHQEDICQALGIPPTRKYQNGGGPSANDLIELLRTQSSDRAADIKTFIEALIFNWLIGGTDAHAKNYSLLIAPGRVRLAPLYDIASALPYDDLDFHKLKLAMKIGGEYAVEDIVLRHWKTLATASRLDVETLLAQIRAMCEHLPDEVETIRKAARKAGLEHVLIDRLAAQLSKRATLCLRQFAYTK